MIHVKILDPQEFKEKLLSNHTVRVKILACGKTYIALYEPGARKIYVARGLLTECMEAVDKAKKIALIIEESLKNIVN